MFTDAGILIRSKEKVSLHVQMTLFQPCKQPTCMFLCVILNTCVLYQVKFSKTHRDEGLMVHKLLIPLLIYVLHCTLSVQPLQHHSSPSLIAL